MGKTRKAAVMYGVDDIRVEDIPMPSDMGDDDVLIRVMSVGVCGSDVHFYKEGKIGAMAVVPPHTLGHECAGEIVEVGANVKHLKVGDRVAVEPGKPCGKCEFCQKGKYNLCPDMIFMSAPHPKKLDEGAFVEYSVRPAGFCFKIPEHVTYDEGAMAEPLSVALQALKRGRVTAGQTMAILGCGPIAFSILLAAKAYGVSEIYMTDVVDYRIDKAAELGAAKAYNVAKDDYINEIIKETNGRGVDVVIDTTANDKAYESMTDIVMRGGVIVLVGMRSDEMAQLNVGAIIDKELDVTSVFRYDNVYQKAVNLIASGMVDMNKLITHKKPLEEVVEALEIAAQRKDNCIKVVVNI